MKYRAHIVACPWVMMAATVPAASCSGGRNETQLEGLQNGISMGIAECTDSNDRAPFLQLTADDGAVSSVVLDCVNADGGFKSPDNACNRRGRSAAGTRPEEYAVGPADRLTSAQSWPVDQDVLC